MGDSCCYRVAIVEKKGVSCSSATLPDHAEMHGIRARCQSENTHDQVSRGSVESCVSPQPDFRGSQDPQLRGKVHDTALPSFSKEIVLSLVKRLISQFWHQMYYHGNTETKVRTTGDRSLGCPA